MELWPGNDKAHTFELSFFVRRRKGQEGILYCESCHNSILSPIFENASIYCKCVRILRTEKEKVELFERLVGHSFEVERCVEGAWLLCARCYRNLVREAIGVRLLNDYVRARSARERKECHWLQLDPSLRRTGIRTKKRRRSDPTDPSEKYHLRKRRRRPTIVEDNEHRRVRIRQDQSSASAQMETDAVDHFLCLSKDGSFRNNMDALRRSKKSRRRRRHRSRKSVRPVTLTFRLPATESEDSSDQSSDEEESSSDSSESESESESQESEETAGSKAEEEEEEVVALEEEEEEEEDGEIESDSDFEVVFVPVSMNKKKKPAPKRKPKPKPKSKRRRRPKAASIAPLLRREHRHRHHHRHHHHSPHHHHRSESIASYGRRRR